MMAGVSVFMLYFRPPPYNNHQDRDIAEPGASIPGKLSFSEQSDNGHRMNNPGQNH